MKKICGTITILILAAAMIALTTCANILDPPQSRQEADTGTVHIVIDGDSTGDRSSARTLAPGQANFIRYTASFEGPGNQADINITGGSASVSLAPGDWNITVTAFTGTDTAAGRGSATVTVSSNQTATANITIVPIIGNGRTGDFRYSVTVPSVDSAVLSLTNMTTNMTISGMPINLKDAADSFGGIAEATLNLDTGYYLMNILLEKSGTYYAGRTEVVHIYDGLETAAVYTFTDNDFGLVVGSLADGVWQDGDMTVSGSEYYRLPVTAETLYAVWWNDSYQGDNSKNLDIKVSAYYETGGVSIFSGVDSGYTSPRVFTAESSGNVIIRVEPYSGANTGTYAVMYGEIRSLGSGTAETGTIATGGVKLYSFSAEASTVYAVSWEDSEDHAGDSSYDGDIKVTAYRGSIGSNILSNFTAVDSGYATPRKVSYTYSTTIYLKVEGVSAGTYSVKYELPVIDLTGGVWQNGDMTVSGAEYYRFPVTEGETYAMYWNDSAQGDGTKTLYSAGVSAYYESGGVSIFSGVNSGYITPQVFTAESSDNVIIRVDPYYSGYTGTYAVMYGEVRPLSIGTVEPGAITAGGVKLYSFPADANMPYEVSWEDSGDHAGSSSYDGDITVTAYRGSIGSNILSNFNAVDSGYATPRKVSYTSSTTFYLKVEGSSSGTYSVKYGTFPIPELTDGVWQNGDMTVSGYEYYRFPVTAETLYAVWWNDSYQGDSSKNLDIKVSAYYETGGVSIFSGVDSGYTSPRVFTAESSGNVIIRVEPYSGTNTGTYAVMYGEIRSLGSGTTETGTIATGGVKLYSFPTDANAVYEVSWEDFGNQAGGSSYDGDIKVTAYRGSIGSSVLFNAVDSGYTTPRTVSYTSSTTVYLKVEGVSDGTYSVKYQQIVQYTITFNADGGSPATQTRTVNDGGTVGSANMPSVPTKSGYNFGGWHTGQNGGGTEFTNSTTVTASITVYAKWTAITYTVAYNANGGSGTIEPSNHTYGTPQDLTANGFTRTGYTFAGWNTQQNGGGTSYTNGQSVSALSTTQGATVTLYAKWTGITYTVRYYANGGSGSTSSSIHTYGTAKALTTNNFTRTGFIFVGWNTQQDGGGTSYTDGHSVSDLSATQSASVSLYAQWIHDVSVTISLWVNQDGNILTSNNDAVTISKSSSGGKLAYFNAAVTGVYTDVQWYLYGYPVYGSQGKEQSIRINAADYAIGNYYLEVMVTKDGKPYSTDIHFTVTN